tara:strand:+ start:3609 stop:4124 length:516 start_codon:yes stop_codon:yes gene_type:complete
MQKDTLSPSCVKDIKIVFFSFSLLSLYLHQTMNVDFVYNTDFTLTNEPEIIQWINAFCKSEGFSIDSLVFAFFNDNKIKDLNIKFLNHDYFTDVISFDESYDGFLKGNIAISIDRVKENANEFSCSFEDELRRVIIHGVLHFMGFKDNTEEEKKKIRAKENFAIDMFHVKR